MLERASMFPNASLFPQTKNIVNPDGWEVGSCAFFRCGLGWVPGGFLGDAPMRSRWVPGGLLCGFLWLSHGV